MPRTVNRQEKQVIITDDTKFILDLFEKAIRGLSEEQQKTLGLSIEPQFRDGLVPSVLKATESVLKKKLGAKARCLGAIECSLNGFAYRLQERYLLSINYLVEAAGKTAKEADKNTIDSRYILVRELLLRLVIVALSDEENKKRSGKPFIIALKDFAKALTTEKGESLGLDFQFRKKLNDQLAPWVSDFESAVTTIELIHAPENALTGLLNYLNHVEKVTKAHILVQYYHVDSKADLNDDWIEKTYQQFLYEKNAKVIAQAKPLTLSMNTLSEEQSEKLKLIKSNRLELIKCDKIDRLVDFFSKNKDDKSDLSVEKAEHLSDLFLLLNHTELLYRMTSRLDVMIQMTEWALLLTQKLSFDGLIKHLEMHRGFCSERLDVEKAGLNTDSKACKMLLAKDYLSGKNITQALPELCEKLEILGSHRHHGLIIELLGENLAELLEYQKQLGIQVICDVPRNQGRSAANQPQPIDYSRAETLLPQIPSRNFTRSVQTRGYSPPTIAAPPVKRTNQLLKPLPVPPPKLNKENEEAGSSKKAALPLSPIQETIMAGEKHESNNVSKGPGDNNGHSVNPNPGPAPSRKAYAYTNYLKVFFDQYEYKDANQQEIIRSLQTKFFNQQIKMGGKNRDESDTTYDRNAFNTPGNFLYSFQDDGLFINAGPFCRNVRSVILEFEKKQMDAKKPDFFLLLFFTSKDILWECRHLELMWMKYLCVETAKKAADERDLEGVVKLCIDKGEWRFNSDYNELKTALQEIVGKLNEGQIRLRKYLVSASTSELEAENARLVEVDAQRQNQINQLQGENQKLKTTVQQQEGKVNRLENTVRQLSGEINRLRGENQELKNTVHQQDGKINQLEATVLQQSGEITQLKAANLQQSGEITQLKAVNLQQSGEITQLKAANLQQSGEITQLKAVNLQQSGEITQLKAANLQQSGEITQLKAANLQQSGEITQLKAANLQQSGEITQLKAIILQQNAKIASFDQTMQVWQAQMQQMLRANNGFPSNERQENSNSNNSGFFSQRVSSARQAKPLPPLPCSKGNSSATNNQQEMSDEAQSQETVNNSLL